jgi:hypothetical protein
MRPQQIGGIAMRTEMWRTEARDTQHGLVGQQVVAAEQSVNGWVIAGKIATVPGQSVGVMRG